MTDINIPGLPHDLSGVDMTIMSLDKLRQSTGLPWEHPSNTLTKEARRKAVEYRVALIQANERHADAVAMRAKFWAGASAAGPNAASPLDPIVVILKMVDDEIGRFRKGWDYKSTKFAFSQFRKLILLRYPKGRSNS